MKKIKILGASLLCAATFSACQDSADQPTQTINTLSMDSVSLSADYFIHKDTANRMIQSYLTSASLDTSVRDNLQSLIMDAGALRSYLQDTSITSVKVMFAHTQKYMDEGHQGQYAGYKSGALTIVFAGFDAAGNYVYAPGNMVPNRLKPCPHQCPSAGTAQSPLLQ